MRDHEDADGFKAVVAYDNDTESVISYFDVTDEDDIEEYLL